MRKRYNFSGTSVLFFLLMCFLAIQGVVMIVSQVWHAVDA
jgi:hypothetical protein